MPDGHDSAAPTVLNVNDRDAARYMVSQMLKASKFQVLEAATGEEALRQAQKTPDAIVLDVRLPDIDGYEVCRRLKAESPTASIPVLLTSAAFTGSEHRVEGLEAGADGYLVQPFEASELSATLRALLRIRAAERNAHDLANELREAVRIRDDFLSIAAHELKTPLTSLQLQLDSLADGLGSERALARKDKLLGKIDTAIRQTSRLAVLVDDLLDVSSITQGRFSIYPEEVDLERIVGDVNGRFSADAARVGSALTLETPGPIAARVDRLRIEQVVANLITNAIKYGGGKPIHTQLSATVSAARLIVRDHGIGIAAQDCERIFGRFERAVSADHYGGLGLGLFITRRIVEAHGGTIHVESELDSGSTFVVELPLAAAAAGAPAKDAPS